MGSWPHRALSVNPKDQRRPDPSRSLSQAQRELRPEGVSDTVSPHTGVGRSASLPQAGLSVLSNLVAREVN